MAESVLKDKKAAIIIAFRNFSDEEYFIPKQILEEAGSKITTVSASLGVAIGSQGGEAEVDILLENLKVEDFDAIIFAGGGGALKYLDNENSYEISRTAVAQNKVLGAICIAPVILAKAGVLSNKKATVWSGVMDRSSIRILKEKEADYQDTSIVVDGRIVTADGPAAAKEFGGVIIKLLKSA
ncbi:DJ-1/PfpI family protein [Patescibacteria group bacterium]|nr:DJ-1/PfpI family protein [Patescibacteria group bacterium]